MTSPRNLEKRLDDLEHDTDQPMPPWFLGSARAAGLSADEIRAEWAKVVEATPADSDPGGTAWDWSLQGKLRFDE